MKQPYKQQQWVKDLMYTIIMLMKEKEYNGDLTSEGYKYAVNGAIDNYSQTYWDKKKKKNISMFHKYEKFDEGIYRNVLISKKAYNLMNDFANEKKSINESQVDKKTKRDLLNRLREKYGLSKELHGEHLTPQSYTRRIINDLFSQTIKEDKLNGNEIRERIDYAFSDAKICITTKNESLILDGKGSRYNSDEICAFLSEYKKIYTDLPEHIASDYMDLEGKLKDRCGFGAIRLYVLMTNGVEFVNYQGKEKSFRECIAYLKDEKYTVWD